MTTVEYVKGSELPDLAVTWTDTNGDVINFASGWTFTVRIGVEGQEAEITKTSGITGSATAPNVTVAWTAGELDDLAVRVWSCQITAHNEVSGKDRVRSLLLQILPEVT